MAEKSKLEKHIEALGEETSGNAHDAVTFSGKGLSLLKSLVGLKKSDKKARDEEDDDDEDEDDDDDEAFAKSDSNGIGANGGGVEDFDEEDEEEDPGQEGDEEIITNHGERLKARAAVRKNEGRKERRFEKSFSEFESAHEDVLDASDALRDLTKHVRSLAKSHAGVNDSVAELHESIRILAKSFQQSLKAQAAMAGELELIKKQPVGAPAPGFLSFAKNDGQGKTRTLSKSEIADVVADAMAEGLVDARTLGRLDFARSQAELQAYVKELPASVQERL